MANAGNLIINIKGDSSGAKKAFNDTKEHATQFKQTMDSVKDSVGNIGGSLQGLTGINLNISQITNTVGSLKNALAAGGIAGLVTAGATAAMSALEGLASKFVQLTQAAMAQAKQLRLTSGELGITAERLQAFQKLATKSGIDPEQATKGLERLNEVLGEFRQGSEEAEKSLKKFGITNMQAAGMGVGDLYATIANKIKDTGSTADRAALAAEVFGKKLGPEMVKMLAQGEAGLDSVMAKMRATGQLMSSGEMVKLNELKSSFAQIQDQFGNAFREVLVSLVPAMKAVANELSGIVKWVGSLIEGAKDALRMLGMMQSKKDEDASNEKDFLKSAGIEQKIDFYSTKLAELKKKSNEGGISSDELNEAKAAQRMLNTLRGTQQQGYLDNEVKKAQELVKAAKDEAFWAGKSKEEKEAAQLHKQFTETGDKRLEAASRELEVMAYKRTYMESQREQWAKEQEHYNELKSKAKQVAEAINPAQKFADEFRTMEEMLKKGLITQQQFSQTLAKDKASILKSLQSEAPQFNVGATKAGSEGMAEVAKLMEQEQQEQWAQKQLDQLTKSLSIQTSSDAELKTIRGILTDNRKVVVTL